MCRFESSRQCSALRRRAAQAGREEENMFFVEVRWSGDGPKFETEASRDLQVKEEGSEPVGERWSCVCERYSVGME